MTTVETYFKVNKTWALTSFISHKTFKDDNDFIETIEDFLFSQILKKSDLWDYVSEDSVLKTLEQNIWK